MKTHPAADAVTAIEAFVAVASGSHERGKREPGVAITRHDRRVLLAFAADGHDLPTGSLTMETHLGYRFCNIPGTEVAEVLQLYNEIRNHAGTWGFHEQQIRDRCLGLVLEARRFVDDAGEALEGIAAGGDLDRSLELLQRARGRMDQEREQTVLAAKGLQGFADHIHTSLVPRLITKLDIVAETRHNTDVFGARAKLRRQLAKIDTEQRAYDRVAGGDEWNLLGRRIERTLYGSAMVEAHGAIETAMHAYKKEIGLVPIVHRLLKSLARRRVFLGHAALAALSGGRGLGHLCTVWMTTVSALDESIAAIRAGKDAAARKAPVQLIEGLRGAWTKVEGLADVNADTLD